MARTPEDRSDALSLPEHIQDVAQRVVHDPDFAAKIRQAALAAVRGGAESDAFGQYWDLWATTPGELAGLSSSSDEPCPCNSNTWFTLSSIVGPLYTCCATTTTTTTTGNFFHPRTPE